jgi:hypothetical protein
MVLAPFKVQLIPQAVLEVVHPLAVEVELQETAQAVPLLLLTQDQEGLAQV